MARVRGIVAYDISDDKARRRLIKLIDSYGVRIQHSVFAFDIGKQQYLDLLTKLGDFYFKSCSARLHKNGKVIKILIVPLCGTCRQSVHAMGCSLVDDKKCLVI